MAYIEREAVLTALCKEICECDKPCEKVCPKYNLIAKFPAADVLPRDEAIKMGAELAAMHGSDATSQQLEEAYLKGVEDGMTRRDVRPVVRGTWGKNGWSIRCSICGYDMPFATRNFCPNCGAVMEEI
jgi:hypothetical protein